MLKSTDRNEDWKDYRSRRNLCTSLQKKDRKDYYRNMYKRMEDEHDSAKIFSTTRELLGWTRAGPPTQFQQDGNIVKTQKEVANIQADFYKNKIKQIKNTLPRVAIDPLKYLKRAYRQWLPPGGMPQFHLKSTTVSEVLKMIKALKNSHAYGRDELDAVTLKIGAPVIAPAICHIINLSLGTGVFPHKWKIARILAYSQVQ